MEYIFGIPGEENLAVMNAIDQSPIRFITTRHEQGAAFMADVYGRLTGKAGVCLATLGPGATNLVTGVADADGDGAPLVAITGQVGTERMHITGHQFLDLTKMFEPITKRTKMVVRPDTVGEIVRLAFKYAESEKPGATHIDLPVNVAKMPVPEGEKPLHKKTAPKEYAELDTVQDAAGMIFQAKNPVILAGSGVVRGHASKELTEFATKLKIPVINTMMAKGVIPFDNPYSMWTIGIPQKDYQNKIMEEADLVIAVGYDIVEYAPAKWNPEGKIDIVHVDMRPAHALSGGPDIPLYAFDTFGTDYPVQARERIMAHAEECWASLALPGICGERLLRLSCDFVGPGYSRPYPGMIEAVRLVAQSEGIVLDPNYTGKSMAGLLDAIRKGAFTADQHVVYLHTGGLPALFAMRRHFA